MDSILNWYREEGLIFKGGSGAGLNLSRIRSSKELLSSGGTASGPVSFMRGADASAGTIKSGGATRRAAKMVVLDVDHPDIVEFVQTKAREEDKIRVLRDAGFDMDLGGSDITSVQYQNANNSVRVSDEFMRAVDEAQPFGLRARSTHEVIDEVDAKDLFRKIAQAAWECADPGIQYDDTINDWHTNPETGRITASNPCSEYMSLDNTSCNLASLNLLTFLTDDNTFAGDRFVKAVELIITAMDISICFADFPTESIGVNTRDYRQLGIGYANLGALLMATGHAYDSDGGRALAAAITSLMTGVAYRRSAELAGVVGPYEGFARNAAAHARVMRKHAAANDAVRAVQRTRPVGPVPGHRRVGPRQQDRREERLAQRPGQRARPHRHHRADDGLRHHRRRARPRAGEVQEAGRRRVDADRQPDGAAGAAHPGLPGGAGRGDRRVHRRARARRRRARPAGRALRGLRLRDGGAGHQGDGPRPDDGGGPAVPVRRDQQDRQPARDGHRRGHRGRLLPGLEARPQGARGLPRQLQGRPAAVRRHKEAKTSETVEAEGDKVIEYRPKRTRLPRSRPSKTTSFAVGGAEGYMTAGSYPDDGLGEVFLKLGKQGSTLAGVMDAFSIAISIALQYGVPLETYVQKFANMRFEPAGLTDDPDIRMAQSVLDYVFRRLALDYLPFETRSAMGIHTASERARQLDTGSYAPLDNDERDGDLDFETLAQSAPVTAPPEVSDEVVAEKALDTPAGVHSSTELLESLAGGAGYSIDAPLCMNCGTKMRPAGSCFVCEGCGSTSGCS